MSDPSIIIAPPSNTWVSDDRHTSPRCSRRDLPKNKHNTRGEDTDHHLLPPLKDPYQLFTRETKDRRGQNIHTREEEDVQCRLLPFQIIGCALSIWFHPWRLPNSKKPEPVLSYRESSPTRTGCLAFGLFI